MYMDSRNGSLVMLDKETMQQVMLLGSLDDSELSKYSLTSTPAHKTPYKPWNGKRDEYCVIKDCEQKEQDDNIPHEDPKEDDEAMEEEEEEQEDANPLAAPEDYATMKKEMGLICVSPHLLNDGSTEVKMAWSWNASIQVVALLHNANKLQVQQHKGHRLGLYAEEATSWKESVRTFSEFGSIYLCIYENTIIVGLSTSARKGLNSQYYIMDLNTGQYLWRTIGDFVWFVSPPVIFNDTLYVITGDGNIIAMNIKDRR